MSNVIRFLESQGVAPSMTPAQYAAAVSALDADASQKNALLRGDRASLDELLGTRRNLFCAVFAADEE